MTGGRVGFRPDRVQMDFEIAEKVCLSTGFVVGHINFGRKGVINQYFLQK